MRARPFLRFVPGALALATALALVPFDGGSEPPGPSLGFTLDGGPVTVPVEPVVLRRRTITPEFDPPLAIRAGRVVYARGFVACDPGETYRVEVTVEQGGVSGTGRTVGRCTGDVQVWTAVVATRSGRFESGPSSACAVATTRRTGITDTFEWCGTPVLAAA